MPDIRHSIATPLDACGDAFVHAAEGALASGELGRVPDTELARVMTAAIRLYAAKADTVGKKPVPVERESSRPPTRL